MPGATASPGTRATVGLMAVHPRSIGLQVEHEGAEIECPNRSPSALTGGS